MIPIALSVHDLQLQFFHSLLFSSPSARNKIQKTGTIKRANSPASKEVSGQKMLLFFLIKFAAGIRDCASSWPTLLHPRTHSSIYSPLFPAHVREACDRSFLPLTKVLSPRPLATQQQQTTGTRMRSAAPSSHSQQQQNCRSGF